MAGVECDGSEIVLRAIRNTDYDKKKDRWSSNLFTGPDTSVSRLKIKTRSELFEIFCQELHKPPKHYVVKGGEIKVEKIKSIGKNYIANGKKAPVNISVLKDPILDHQKYIDNPAHAIIPKKRSRGLAFAIIKELKLHDAPSCEKKNIKVSNKVLFVIILIILFILPALFLLI